jgi:hypothetical protein
LSICLAASSGGLVRYLPVTIQPSPWRAARRAAARLTGVEVTAERREFEVHPPDADPETQPAAAEHIDLRGLLGQSDCLAERQHYDRWLQPNTLCDAGQEPAQHQRLVPDRPMGEAERLLGMAGWVRADDMLVDGNVVEPEVLGCLRPVADRYLVDADPVRYSRPLGLGPIVPAVVLLYGVG